MRRYQTRLAGGPVVKPASPEPFDHVVRAVAEAKAGREAWIRTRDPDDDLAKFYTIQFRQRDGRIQVTCFEWQLIINPDHVTSPSWVTEIANIARRILTPEQSQENQPCPTLSSN